jgi:hypothetical protein
VKEIEEREWKESGKRVKKEREIDRKRKLNTLFIRYA